jgi:hypothetical protein
MQHKIYENKNIFLLNIFIFKMDLLIKSPKITRGKGIRSVKDTVEKDRINEVDAAYNKLFNHYLSNQQQDKSLVRKLVNHDYFEHLLRNKKELQYMNMELLSKVLLFLDSKDDISSRNTKQEILDGLNDFSTKQTKKVDDSKETKEYKEYKQNKEILDFFRYVRFVEELINEQDLKVENEDEEEVRAWFKQKKLPMIHPHTNDFV